MFKNLRATIGPQALRGVDGLTVVPIVVPPPRPRAFGHVPLDLSVRWGGAVECGYGG